MSWTRTVRCSFCYNTGHNKTTCPTMRQQAADDPDGYAARRLNRIKARKKATVRCCSYCSEAGHTKRTCPEKSVDADKLNAGNRVWRSKLLISMKDKGCGIGSLLQFLDNPQKSLTFRRHGLKAGDVAIIASIDWVSLGVGQSSWHYREKEESISYRLIHRIVNSQSGGKLTCYVPSLGESRNFQLPELFDENGTALIDHASSFYKIINPSDPQPPAGWVDSDDWAQKVM